LSPIRTPRSTDTFEKFKTLQRELSEQKAQLVYLEEQRKKLDVVVATARQVRESERERGRVVDEIKAMVAKPTTIYESFRRVFNGYCQRVLSHEGIFYFYVNTNGNFDYTIGLGLPGQAGKTSSQGEGTSYKKLVCALFDLALLKVYEDVGFFHFVSLSLRREMIVSTFFPPSAWSRNVVKTTPPDLSGASRKRRSCAFCFAKPKFGIESLPASIHVTSLAAVGGFVEITGASFLIPSRLTGSAPDSSSLLPPRIAPTSILFSESAPLDARALASLGFGFSLAEAVAESDTKEN